MKKPLKAQNLNSLLYLQVLLQEKHVSRAAHKAGLSQPGMSHVLKDLRLLLEDPILVPGKKGYQPTEKAKKVQKSLEKALSLVEASLYEDTFEPAQETCHFKLMMTDYAGFVFLPKLMNHVAAYPHITLEIVPWENLDTTHQDFDLAIGFDQKKLPKAFKSELLYQEHYVCMCKKEHPRIADMLTLEAFLEEPHVIVREKDGAIGVVNQALAKLGLLESRKIHLEVAHFLLFPFIIAQTNMLITTTSRNALLFLDKLPIKILPVPLEIPSMPVKTFYHQHHENNPSHLWLRKLLHAISQSV